MKNKNKRGELTSRQLIIIIILIVSFAIIIAFFFMLGLRSMIGGETCRNSVMMRGIPFGDWVVSLKCKTQDVCFSMGGECEEGADEVIKVENEIELEKEMNNLKIDCWWMMGEGKVDYGSEGSCAICYKVYFGEEIKKEYEIISLNEQVHTNEVYALITQIRDGEDRYPKFVKYTSEELGEDELGCSKYVTEV